MYGMSSKLLFVIFTIVAFSCSAKEQVNPRKNEADKTFVEKNLPSVSKSEADQAEKLYTAAFTASDAIKSTGCTRGSITDQQTNQYVFEFINSATKFDREAYQKAQHALFLANTGEDKLAPLAEKFSRGSKEMFKFVFTMRLLHAVNATAARCYDYASDQYVKISETYANFLPETDVRRLVRDKLEDISYRRKAFP